MAEKAKHAFGSSQNIEAAKQANKINAYDILFLDGDTDSPKVGWLDAQGNTVIVKDKEQIVRVDELPTTDGDENVVYIYNNECYIWNGSECVTICKPADLTELETELANKANASDVEALEKEMETKVDATTVQSMIEEHSSAVIEVVEF